MTSPILEVIGFDLEGCHIAQDCGADRIELCANPNLGGTTPSRELILKAREHLNIPLYVMIRPRGGGFHYNTSELEQMKDDIAFCESIDCDGVVLGMLTKDNHVDIVNLSEMMQLISKCGVTFHRAFDLVQNPAKSMLEIMQLGFERILTSGQKPTAIEGAELLKSLIQHSPNMIMPGSGITAENLPQLHAEVGARQYHSSAKVTDVHGNYQGVDPKEVQNMRKVLDNFSIA